MKWRQLLTISMLLLICTTLSGCLSVKSNSVNNKTINPITVKLQGITQDNQGSDHDLIAVKFTSSLNLFKRKFEAKAFQNDTELSLRGYSVNANLMIYEWILNDDSPVTVKTLDPDFSGNNSETVFYLQSQKSALTSGLFIYPIN